MEVRVEDLTRHFGKTRAVDGISFSFGSGQIVAFVGPNGAGKTTTMRVLATLDEPTAGEAFLDGVSIIQDPEKARHLVGFMPDSLPSHRDICVHEYLDFFARAYGIKAQRRRGVVRDIQEFTNLTDIAEKALRALSKGMKQRLSLARALIHDPPVLILDEPAAGLDPRARVELRELLKILAQQGKAVLVSSHILTELSEICDSTVIIEQGKILRAGSIEEIHAAETPHRTVTVRAMCPQEHLHRCLLEVPHVDAARIVGTGVEVDIAADQRACADVLAELVRRGVPVVEYTPRRADLEELFMNITKGRVQ